MKTRFKNILQILICSVLAFGIITMPVFAEGSEDQSTDQDQITDNSSEEGTEKEGNESIPTDNNANEKISDDSSEKKNLSENNPASDTAGSPDEQDDSDIDPEKTDNSIMSDDSGNNSNKAPADANGDSLSLDMTVDGLDANGELVADHTATLTIVANMPMTSADKTLTVDIPAGWVVIGYSASDSDDDHSMTIPRQVMEVDVEAAQHIRIDPEYIDIIERVTLDPNTGDSKYGNVSSDDGTWENQTIDGYSHLNEGKVYPGKLTYTLAENADNVRLVVQIRPQPTIIPRAGTVAKEEMPPINATLSCQKDGEEAAVKETSVNITANNIPRLAIRALDPTYNLSADEETSKIHFEVRASASQYLGSTAHRAWKSLGDKSTLIIEYPEGVFYSDDQTGALIKGNIQINEDPVKGGGTITITAEKSVFQHNIDMFKLYFDVKVGDEFKPDCPKTYGKDKNPEDFVITARGSVERVGETKDLGPIKFTRTVYIGAEEGSYLISLNNNDVIRRDLKEDFGMDEYDILLTNTGFTSQFAYDGVPFHFENKDNKLGITGIRMVGKQIRDIEIKTFNADGTEGRTITKSGPYGTSPSAAGFGNYMISGHEIGLNEGEYISEVYLKTDVSQLPYSNAYLNSGIGFMGQYIDNTPGQVDISIVKLDEEGNYTGEVALNAETKEPIKSHASATPGVDTIGGGYATTTVRKTPDGSHEMNWYPNDVLYFQSTLSSASMRYTQTTTIDPTITISLPEGLELNTDSVLAYSAAGNHKDEWFDLLYVTDRNVEIDGVTWHCYDFTSKNTLDMIANEKDTNQGNFGGTVSREETEITIKFNTVVTSTCPQYSLKTQDCVLWYVGGEPGKVYTATGGEGHVITDTDDRMGRGNKYQAVIGKNEFFIKPLVGLGMDLAIRPVEQPEADWKTWAGGENTVATVHEGKPAEVRLSYVSNSESEHFKDTIIYLPIPKKGNSFDYLTNVELSAPVDNPDIREFQFTANLTGPISMIGEGTKWKTLYATSATSNPVKYDDVEESERDRWEPVIAEWTQNPENWEKVVLVKFVALEDILPGKTGEAVFTMDIDPNAQFGSYDLWRGYGRAKLGQAANHWKYTPVVAATPTSATFLGQIFIDDDMNAAFDDDEDGYGTNFTAKLAHDDNVVAPIEVTVNADGTMKLQDDKGRQIYLRIGDYTLTVTKSNEETVYDYERVESDTASSSEKWYNNIKNADIDGNVAVAKFTVDKSGTVRRAAVSFVPETYYTGVGLAKLNNFNFTKLGEVENEDGGSDDEPLEGAKFALYTDSSCSTPAARLETAYESVSDEDGKVEFEDVVAGTYYMKEITSGNDDIYLTNTSVYKVVVSNDTPVVTITVQTADQNTGDLGGNQESGYTILNKQKTGIDGTKIWNDGDDENRPTQILIKIIGTIGEEAEKVVEKTVTVVLGQTEGNEIQAIENEDGSWSFTINNLKKFAKNTLIEYKLEEIPIDGYLDETSEDGLTITNTKTIDIPVEKKWNDGNNANNTRPFSITVQLMEGNKTIEGKTLTLNADNQWKGTFSDLPMYDSNKQEIAYTVAEVETDGYVSEMAGDKDSGFTITNTLLTEATVRKIWADGENTLNKRPQTLEFELFQQSGSGSKTVVKDADGNTVTVTLPIDNKWEDTVEDLPKYDTEGNEITYSWTEDEDGLTDGYTLTDTTTNGSVTTFINTLQTKIIVVKEWENQDNEEFIPDDLTMQLKAGNELTQEVSLTATDHWTQTFENQNVFDDNGNRITYTINEPVTPSGYNVTYSEPDTDENGVITLTAVNTYSAKGTLDLGGLKKLSSESGKLTEGQFTFTVKDNGTEIATGTNDADGNIIFSPETITYQYAIVNDEKIDDRGDHTLVITETGEDGNGVKADADPVTVKVSVTDNGNGTLTVTPDDITSSVEMTNTYSAVGEGEIFVQKILDGRDWKDDDVFTFTISSEDKNTPMPENDIIEITNADNNFKKSFGKIKFTAEGTYTYTVKEKVGNIRGIIYDETEYSVVIRTIDDGKGNILAAEDSELTPTVTIVNVFIDITVNKVDDKNNALKGAELAVKDESGNIVDKWISDGTPHMVKNLLAYGKFTLTELNAPPGYEKAPDIQFTTYADSRLQVLTMVDKKTIVPDTSDHNHTIQWVTTLILSLILAGYVLYERRKHSY